MSTLPTIRIGGAPSPEDAGAPSSAPGKTSKLPTIRIGGDAPAPGKTGKIPAAAVPAPTSAEEVVDIPAEEVVDIVDVDAPAPAAPAPAPAEPTPVPAEPAPAPAEPTPAQAPAPEASKTGLRPGLKLPPRVGGVSTKKRAPVRAGLKLPPKPGATAPAAAAAAKPAAASPAAPAPDKKAADAPKKSADDGRKPDGKDADKTAGDKPKKRSLFVRLVRQVPNLVLLLAAMTATAWLRVAHFPPVDAPVAPRPAPAAAAKKPVAKASDVSPWIRTAKAKAGKLPRIVHAAAPQPVEEPVAGPEEPVVEEVVEEAPKEPKKKQIVKRVPADLFEDALLETVKMLRTMPQADACRAAVNSFSDIANKERERSRECYRVITALNSAKNWDDLVAETIFDNPKKREIKVGNTTHVIVPTGTIPGAIVCKRYVNGTVLFDQRIALADMTPQEKLRILRGEKPDPAPSSLYGRALLELVYGSPKTFKAFVDRHKRIEGMKAFYVVYELERLKQ